MSKQKINIQEFSSTSGLATKKWGPSGWNFLFSCIMGAYPVNLNPSDKHHRAIKHHFKSMLLSLTYTMPCIFCRQSFAGFIKEIPIEPFMGGRIDLMFWLYLIRDKVNRKLIEQEQKCYNDEKKKLKIAYHSNLITQSEYYQKLQRAKIQHLYTSPSPPFIDVLKKYEQYRAVCSKKSKTCALPETH